MADFNKFSSKFSKFGQAPSPEVNIIDQMDAYSQLLAKSQKKKYDKIQEEQNKPSFFQKVVSVLSTGETGQATYDLLEGKNPVASYGKSVANSLQGKSYDKKTYANVLEKLGMKRGALSELMPWLYNETGEGWKFKKNGFLDPTARGALGLTLDILADPTTYMGGAGLVKRGIKSMKGLSSAGKEAAEGITRKYTHLAAKVTDPMESAKLWEQASEEIAKKVKSNPDKYFSGLKFMGKEIIPRDKVLLPGRYADKLMNHIPIVNKVYIGAKEGVQDVFKYGADVLRKGKTLGHTGSETAETYVNLKKKWSREADYSFEKLYKSLDDTRKDFHNAVSKADRDTARDYIIDKIETSFSHFGVKGIDEKTADNFIDIIKKYQDDIYQGTARSREGLRKEMFDELQGYLPHVMTPEAKKAMAKLNMAKFKGSQVTDYAISSGDKSRTLWKYKAADGTELFGNAKNLQLREYKQAAEEAFLNRHYKKLLKTQNKYLNEIDRGLTALEKKKMQALRIVDDSTKFDSDALLKKINELDYFIQKKKGKANPITLKIDAIKKELADNIDELPDAGKYFKDNTGKVFTIDRPMSIKEINADKNIQKLLKEAGFEGKNFFETDPFAITLARGQKAVREIEKNSLLKDVANRFGVQGDAYKVVKRTGATRKTRVTTQYAEQIKDGIRYIDPEIKELPEGMLLPDFIVADLKKTVNALKDDEVISKVLKLYDNTINSWKGLVYGWFPASHGRNYIGGSFMNFNANPKWVNHTGKVRKILKGSDDVIDLGNKSIYKNLTHQQIKEEIGRRGFFSQTGALDINDINKSFNTSFWKKTSKMPMEAGTFVEANLRIPLFLAEVADGKTFDDAMKTVYRYHFDYAPRAATQVERQVLKRLIPFYTWQRNAIPLMVEQLIETPGRMTAFYKAIREADDGSGDINRALLPSYLERDPAIMRGGQAISGLGLPPNEALKFFDSPVDTALSALTPALKIPIELRTNFNLFKDKQITEDVNGEFARNYPQAVKDWLEFDDSTFIGKDGKTVTYSRVNPMRKYWLYALPTGRLSSIISMSLGDNEKNKTAKILTGISTIETDLEQMKATKDKQYEEKLKEILINAGIYSEYGTAFKSSKEDLRQLQQ